MKIAFQGEHGAYSEAAAGNLFGPVHKFVPLPYFDDVFAAVKNGAVNRGIIPIENSLAGSIHQNYDLLQKYRLNIICETQLRVEHVLMCHKSTTEKNLQEVRSHPQALAQCSKFFARRKSLTQFAFYDTAGSAKFVAEQKPAHVGAIASIHAARIYGLKSLRRNLENDHRNYTRFLGISRNPTPKARFNSNMKTSISLAPKVNQTGILFKMLEIFAHFELNLLKIESRPIPNRTFEYLFYLDFEGSQAEARVKEALQRLKKHSSLLVVFGSYQKGGKSYLK